MSIDEPEVTTLPDGYATRWAQPNGPRELHRPTTLRLYTPAELLDFPEPVWLVEPFLVDGCLSILYGSSGSFKSFLALDWAGRAAGLAVYISAEGSPKRLGERNRRVGTRRPTIEPHRLPAALARPHRRGPRPRNSDPRTTRTRPPDRRRHRRRNMAGADENSTKDMSALVASLDYLRAEFGAAILAIHHTGHENTERERGSSALRAAADISIFARRGDAPLTVRLKCAKVRRRRVPTKHRPPRAHRRNARRSHRRHRRRSPRPGGQRLPRQASRSVTAGGRTRGNRRDRRHARRIPKGAPQCAPP